MSVNEYFGSEHDTPALRAIIDLSVLGETLRVDNWPEFSVENSDKWSDTALTKFNRIFEDLDGALRTKGMVVKAFYGTAIPPAPVPMLAERAAQHLSELWQVYKELCNKVLETDSEDGEGILKVCYDVWMGLYYLRRAYVDTTSNERKRSTQIEVETSVMKKAKSSQGKASLGNAQTTTGALKKDANSPQPENTTQISAHSKQRLPGRKGTKSLISSSSTLASLSQAESANIPAENYIAVNAGASSAECKESKKSEARVDIPLQQSSEPSRTLNPVSASAISPINSKSTTVQVKISESSLRPVIPPIHVGSKSQRKTIPAYSTLAQAISPVQSTALRKSTTTLPLPASSRIAPSITHFSAVYSPGPSKSECQASNARSHSSPVNKHAANNPWLGCSASNPVPDRFRMQQPRHSLPATMSSPTAPAAMSNASGRGVHFGRKSSADFYRPTYSNAQRDRHSFSPSNRFSASRNGVLSTEHTALEMCQESPRRRRGIACDALRFNYVSFEIESKEGARRIFLVIEWEK